MAKGRSGAGCRSVGRSASTGRFVSKGTVATWPGKMVTQTVGGGAKGTERTVNRSASTGRFVQASTAQWHPNATATEQG